MAYLDLIYVGSIFLFFLKVITIHCFGERIAQKKHGVRFPGKDLDHKLPNSDVACFTSKVCSVYPLSTILFNLLGLFNH